MIYYHTPIGKAKIKNSKKKKLVTTSNMHEDKEKLDHSCIAGGNIKWYSPSGKRFLQNKTKQNMQILYDPEIALLNIYPREVKACSHRNLHMNVFRSIIPNSQKLGGKHVSFFLIVQANSFPPPLFFLNYFFLTFTF